MDTLNYRSTVRPYVSFGRGGFRSRREYAEWIVNDVPLAILLGSSKPGFTTDAGLDLIPVVSWNTMGTVEVERLLLRRPADFPGGRHSLLTCPECGDPTCGRVSAVVERTDDAFIWHTFGWECIYFESDETELDDFAGKGPFRFDPTEYERVLREMNALGVKS